MIMDKQNLIGLIFVVSVILVISLLVKIYSKLTEKKRKDEAEKELMKILNNPFDITKERGKLTQENTNDPSIKKHTVKKRIFYRYVEPIFLMIFGIGFFVYIIWLNWGNWTDWFKNIFEMVFVISFIWCFIASFGFFLFAQSEKKINNVEDSYLYMKKSAIYGILSSTLLFLYRIFYLGRF